MAKKQPDLLSALRAASPSRKTLRALDVEEPLKAEFHKRLRTDPAVAVAWLAERYVERHAEREAAVLAERKFLAHEHAESKKTAVAARRQLGATTEHLRRLAAASRIDMDIVPAGADPELRRRARITDADLRAVERVLRKARTTAEDDIQAPPDPRPRGRPADRLRFTLVELLRAAGLRNTAIATHVGYLLNPGNRILAERAASSLRTALSKKNII